MKRWQIALLLGTVLLTGCGQSDQGFEKGYTEYLVSGGKKEVSDDSNWIVREDSTVSITFKSTEGPMECYVTMLCKEGESGDWEEKVTETLDLAESLEYALPADTSFRFSVGHAEGKNGNVTFDVKVS